MTTKFITDPWARITTRNGLAADEVISALQKSIRRGWTEKACEFAYEMYTSNGRKALEETSFNIS